MTVDAGMPRLLSGVTVRLLGRSIVTSSTGMTLGKLGAEVVRVDDGSDLDAPVEERRLCDFLEEMGAVAIRPRSDGPLVNGSVPADLTVVDAASLGALTSKAAVADYQRQVQEANSSAWVTVSPFGLEGERSHWKGSDLITHAAGGTCHYMRTSDGRPMKPAGHTASITAGQFAALAGLHAVRLERVRREPIHLDLSIQDSVVVSGVFLECAHISFDCPGPGGTGRYSSPKGITACRDGLMEIVVLEDHQWERLKQVMGNPEWAQSVQNRDDRRARAAELQERFGEWAKQFTVQQCVETLQGAGVPATSVNSPADLLADPDLARREFFDSVGGIRMPGLPVVAEPLPGRDLEPVVTSGETSSDLAEGSNAPICRAPRVLDLSHVLAGPLGTAWLGAMGFDVVKVEDPERVDTYRRGGPFVGGVVNHEASAYFAASNFCKRSVCLSMTSAEDRDRFQELVRASDYVVENLSFARSAAVLGGSDGPITPKAAQVSSSGFGRLRSDRKEWRAYGHNIHAQGGLIWLSRDRFNEPRDLGTSWADPLTALWIALLVNAQDVSTLRGAYYDVSMVEAVAAEFPDFFLAHQEGATAGATENRMSGYSPHGMFRCAHDGWIAIAVRGESEWDAFSKTLGSPAALGPFRSEDARIRDPATLEAAIEACTAKLDAAQLAADLQAAGVAAFPVLGARDLLADEHLHNRGFFHAVTHAVWGQRRLAGLPWREAGVGPIPIAPPPITGEHSTAVIEELDSSSQLERHDQLAASATRKGE
jgi:crotonobetainyl-CoA:carnitine CoA-transferase CaiB-like acyl-CoA transferase